MFMMHILTFGITNRGDRASQSYEDYRVKYKQIKQNIV